MNEEKASASIRWLTTKRLESLSDGIFAIAMTILVLNLRVPLMTDTEAVTKLPGILRGLWPNFFAYTLSFLLLAAFWIMHHKQFHAIKKVDEPLLWLNIISMLFVVMIPFSTYLYGEYETSRTAALFFEGNLGLAGAAFFLTYWYATKDHRLVDDDLDARRVSLTRKRTALMPVVSVLAIGISFISPQYSTLAYLLIPVILVGFLKD